MKFSESELIERLAAWWRRLDEGINSGNPIMDALNSEFGEDTVGSENVYALTDESFKKIFDILNDTLFEGLIIKTPELIACGKAGILQKIQKTNAVDFNPNVYSHVFVGMFYSTYDILRNGKSVYEIPDYIYDGSEEVVFSNEMIFINLDESSEFSFMAYVNCIAHEMIHCFDEYLGSTKQRILVMYQFGEKLDGYKSDMFVKKQAEVNSSGLNVVDKLFESGKIYYRMTMKEALEKRKHMEPRKYRSVRDNGKWYVDMHDAPDLDTDTELHVTIGPHTKALIQFD